MIHLHLQECNSTQKEVIKQINASRKAPLLVSTENQLSGMGQRGNDWKFYPGSLAFSFTISPPDPVQLAPMEIGILFCLYVSEKVKLKWPNDLMMNGKKCGGILCQFINDVVVVGIGINISQKKLENEPDFKFEPGSFSWMTKDLQKKWPLDFYQFVQKNRLSADSVLNQFQKHCDHINRPVSVIDKNIQGVFKGLGKNGEALIVNESQHYQIISGSLFYN